MIAGPIKHLLQKKIGLDERPKIRQLTGPREGFFHFRIPRVTKREKTCFLKNSDFLIKKRAIFIIKNVQNKHLLIYIFF